MSGVALLDKAGWAPLGAGEHETHPVLIGLVGLAMVVLVPLVWGVLRRTTGLSVFGSPTIAEVEDPSYRPGGLAGADARDQLTPRTRWSTRSTRPTSSQLVRTAIVPKSEARTRLCVRRRGSSVGLE